MVAVDAEPAKPPARDVAAVRVDCEEADEFARFLDADELVRRATADCLDDLGQRAEEAFDLVGVELEAMDMMQFARGELPIRERRGTSGGGHGVLQRQEGKNGSQALRSSTQNYAVKCTPGI